VVNAPERLREQLRALETDQLLVRCARLRSHPSQPIEHRATITGLRRTAQRALALQAEADDFQGRARHPGRQARAAAAGRARRGIICAAQLLTAWSHPGRLSSEAAFAMLGGAAPIEAWSGKVVGHRLNRSGDRQLNRALHHRLVAHHSPRPNTCLRRPPHSQGQDAAGDQTLPEALPRPPAVQAPPDLASAHPKRADRDHLTTIEASEPYGLRHHRPRR
jgi:hypothetical protein